MILLNQKMLDKLTVDFSERVLQPSLKDLLNDGFFEADDCYFVKSLKRQQSHAKREDFPDRTAYECFVNSVHIDDFVESDFLTQASLFVVEVFKLWNSIQADLVLKSVIGQTEYGVNVKFHLSRANETWIVDDEIERFEEAIMIRYSK